MDLTDTVGRIIARARRRALLVRATSALVPDPTSVFGIAFIRVAGEESLQAVACGTLGERLTISLCINPLDRSISHLEPLAESLRAYMKACVQRQELPRIWLGHEAAMKCLELLAFRYRSNKAAPESIRTLGMLCQLLVDETTYPGQQTVAVCDRLLRQHVLTGQSPGDDLHLDALLAWLDPVEGVDPVVEADRRALEPASSLLSRPDDNRVERLRRTARMESLGRQGSTLTRSNMSRVRPRTSRRARLEVARSEIERLLTKGVLREWGLLVQARNAFWGLGLPASPAHAVLTKVSLERISYAVKEGYLPPSRSNSMALLLGEQEYLQDLVEALDIRYDSQMRERARTSGRVFQGELVSVEQPTRNRKPCVVLYRTGQEVLRVRRGTKLQVLDTKVQGRVTAVRSEESSGDTLIEMSLSEGLKSDKLPLPGTSADIADSVVLDMRAQDRKISKEMREAAKAADPNFSTSGANDAGSSDRESLGDLMRFLERLQLGD